MKLIAKNNCDFPRLRKSGCLYIDKTAGKPVWAVGLSFNGKTRQFKGGRAESVK